MRRLIFRLVLPLTIISFLIFTKWWYAVVVDGTDEILYGFPLVYTCRGFHTSLSMQFFLLELCIDVLTYFLICFLLVFLINRYVKKIYISKILSVVLLVISGLMLSFSIFIMSLPENIFHTKRPFEIETMTTGYKFIWTKQVRPDYYQYHPPKNK